LSAKLACGPTDTDSIMVRTAALSNLFDWGDVTVISTVRGPLKTAIHLS
jgi:hypothetical protein